MIDLKKYSGVSVKRLLGLIKQTNGGSEKELLHYALGMEHFRKGRLQSALNAFERCETLSKEFAEPVYRSGECLYRMKRLPEALRSFQEVENRFPRYVNTTFNIGIIHYRLGDHAAAARYLETYRYFHPHDQAVPYYLGQCYASLGDSCHEKAVACFEAASRAGRYKDRAALELSMLRLKAAVSNRSGGVYELAAETERRLGSIKGLPRSIKGPVHVFLANLFESDPSLVPKAIRHYTASLQCSTGDVDIHLRLAGLLLSKGDTRGALKFAIGAVELAPDESEAYSVIQDVLKDALARKDEGQLRRMIQRIKRSRKVDLGTLIVETIKDLTSESRENNYANLHKIKNVINILCHRTIGVRQMVSEASKTSVRKADDVLVELIEMQKRAVQNVSNLLKLMGQPEQARSLENVNNLVRKICLMVRHESGSTVSFELKLDEPLPLVLLNRDEITEALTNIIMNASQASGPNEGISITTRKRGDEIRIAIRDSGCGIKSGDLKRVFDLGFTTKPDGSGYGLNIAKKVAEAHGGEIRIRSQYKKWTEVTIVLPVSAETDFSRSTTTRIKTFSAQKRQVGRTGEKVQ